MEINLDWALPPCQPLSAKRQSASVNCAARSARVEIISTAMIRPIIRRCAIALAAWLPFFALWVLFAMSFARDPFSTILLASLISMGSAGLLGIAVWQASRRWAWPLGFNPKFYLLQVFFALIYVASWTIAIYGLESLRRGGAVPGF